MNAKIGMVGFLLVSLLSASSLLADDDTVESMCVGSRVYYKVGNTCTPAAPTSLQWTTNSPRVTGYLYTTMMALEFMFRDLTTSTTENYQSDLQQAEQQIDNLTKQLSNDPGGASSALTNAKLQDYYTPLITLPIKFAENFQSTYGPIYDLRDNGPNNDPDFWNYNITEELQLVLDKFHETAFADGVDERGLSPVVWSEENKATILAFTTQLQSTLSQLFMQQWAKNTNLQKLDASLQAIIATATPIAVCPIDDLPPKDEDPCRPPVTNNCPKGYVPNANGNVCTKPQQAITPVAKASGCNASRSSGVSGALLALFGLMTLAMMRTRRSKL